VLKRLSIWLCSLLVAACSGGGSGSGGTADARFVVSPLSLTFSALSASSAAPSSQVINVSVTAGDVYLDVSFTGAAIEHITFDITGEDSAIITVYPANPAGLGVGSHSGTVTFTGCHDQNCDSPISGGVVNVTVSYIVPGVTVSPSSLSYSIANSPAAADLTRSISVAATPTQNYSVAVNAAWLSATPPMGTSSGPVTVSLVSGQIGTMYNGTYRGEITVTPTAGVPVTIPATLALDRTQINYVSPYVVLSGASGDVTIRGVHFSRVSVQNIRFGAHDATSFTQASDTEIRASFPALVAGSYPVTLVTASGSYLSRATLVVQDPMALPYAAFMNGGGFARSIIYDAERRGIIYRRGSVTIGSYRYNLATSTWEGAEHEFDNRNVPISYYGMDLTPDGKELFILRKDGDPSNPPPTLRKIDAQALSVVGDVFTLPGDEVARGLTIANDGSAVFPLTNSSESLRLGRYRLFDGVASYSTPLSGTRSSANLISSRDRSVAVLSSGDGSSDTLASYDASSGAVTESTTAVATSTAVTDQSGRRYIFADSSVYDFDKTTGTFTFRGNLSTGAGIIRCASALSPDGTKAYLYSINSNLVGQIHMYDISAPAVGGVYTSSTTGFPIDLADSPGSLGARMAISLDGRTAFVVAINGLVIQPLP
jgi:hypothetical protein